MRRLLPPEGVCIPAVEIKGSLLLENVRVLLPALGKLVTRIAHIVTECNLMISVIAHTGDGNTHPLIVYNFPDAAITERAHHAFGEIMDMAVILGGTIAGEHGVGRLQRPMAGRLSRAPRDGAQPAHQARIGPLWLT